MARSGLASAYCSATAPSTTIGIDLAVDKLVDKVSHEGEGDEVRAFHLVGDDGFLGGGGLCADALAGEVGEGVVLIGGVSLDKDHGRQVGVVGIGEVSGLETLGRDLDGCHDDIKIALGKGGEQVVEAHVLDLKLHAQLIGDVLAGGNVDTGVLHRAAVIGIHEFVRGVVSGGAEHQRAAGLLGVVVGVGIIGVVAVVGLLPQATSERLIIRASISAVNFFMVDSSFFNFFPSCIMFDR